MEDETKLDLDEPAARPPDCPECAHYRGELEKSRKLVRIVDDSNERLDAERDQLQARVAELEDRHAVGWNRLEELDDELLGMGSQLEAKIAQVEAWREAALSCLGVPGVHSTACISNVTLGCDCPVGRAIYTVEKARALDKATEPE